MDRVCVIARYPVTSQDHVTREVDALDAVTVLQTLVSQLSMRRWIARGRRIFPDEFFGLLRLEFRRLARIDLRVLMLQKSRRYE